MGKFYREQQICNVTIKFDILMGKWCFKVTILRKCSLKTYKKIKYPVHDDHWQTNSSYYIAERNETVILTHKSVLEEKRNVCFDICRSISITDIFFCRKNEITLLISFYLSMLNFTLFFYNFYTWHYNFMAKIAHFNIYQRVFFCKIPSEF